MAGDRYDLVSTVFDGPFERQCWVVQDYVDRGFTRFVRFNWVECRWVDAVWEELMFDRQRAFVSDVAGVDAEGVDLEAVPGGLEVLSKFGPRDVRDREVDRDFGAALFDAAGFIEATVDAG